MIALEARLRDAFRAVCHPIGAAGTSVRSMEVVLAAASPMGGIGVEAAPPRGATIDVGALVVRLYQEEAVPLVRLARLFVDDRNAAEDLVQEGFIRLSRSAHRIEDPVKAAAYLRSIVLNLVRDHNRRGLVSLRHHLPADDQQATAEDEVVLRDDQRQVIDAVRALAPRQRDCVLLRYYFESSIAEVAESLGISENSVKTHLKRGLAALQLRLETGR